MFVPRPRPAYTLMEVVLVMALMLTLGALAYPMVDSLYANSRLTAASDQIRARWSETRSRALEERRNYRFAVKDNTGKFRIAPDTQEFWPDGDPSADPGNPDQKPLVLENTLPDRVLFGNGNAQAGGNSQAGSNPQGGGNTQPSGGSAGWRTVVTFLSDGTAKEDVEVTFSTRGARSVTLKLRGATGTTTTAALAVRLSDS